MSGAIRVARKLKAIDVNWAQTYYRWRHEFGGLKDLELQNSRLRKAVSDLTLDKLILQEAARGNF